MDEEDPRGLREARVRGVRAKEGQKRPAGLGGPRGRAYWPTWLGKVGPMRGPVGLDSLLPLPN